MHARGPAGVEQLRAFKDRAPGDGQIRPLGGRPCAELSLFSLMTGQKQEKSLPSGAISHEKDHWIQQLSQKQHFA